MGVAFGVNLVAPQAGSIAALSPISLLGPATTLKVFVSSCVTSTNFDTKLTSGELFATTPAVGDFECLVSFVSQIGEHQEKLASAESEIKDLGAKANFLEKIQVTLGIQEDAIENIAGRMDHLAAIWSYVAFDAGRIAQDLRSVLIEDENKKAFLIRLNLVQSAYKTLTSILKEYAKRIEGHSFRFCQVRP
ncbi:hypothetical protein H0H81_008985 [Sphagnurus paluster]|uniref:Uncharacterized protein n=1 Tax=Sphagnurus paluster TaxID=117069 RepID=A0A9P7FSC5_9AGAR|nr:hypothetical protein H0H81_008985 [Sphagnurus paluster]